MFGAPVTIAQTTSLAHFAALPVLIDRGDAVLVDQFVHMSVQAVLPTLREAGVSCSMLRHNRMDRLREQITALGKQYRRVWYLADGVYSMSGGAAPMGVLRELLAQHTSLHLYIDDAHGMSWTGRHGRGHALGVEGIHPRMVVALSLAKAFSASGAALVFADRELARLVRTCGSTMIFSGPLQPALLGAAIASAHIHLSDEIVERQFLLRERIELFNTLARERGLSLASDAASPVRFVEIGPEEVTCRIGEVLMNAGYYTNIAMYPAVPKRRAGIRIAITLHQTLEDIRNLVDRLGDLCSRTNVA
jgi:7-keto-8-aminopelargonate synthetase-like enzyme